MCVHEWNRVCVVVSVYVFAVVYVVVRVYCLLMTVCQSMGGDDISSVSNVSLLISDFL